jgi:hypothetical protein
MLFFFISLVVACVIPRRWLLRTGELGGRLLTNYE